MLAIVTYEDQDAVKQNASAVAGQALHFATSCTAQHFPKLSLSCTYVRMYLGVK